MSSNAIIYFDIAAVVIMAFSLSSLMFRGLTRGAANRVYLTAMVLVTVTAAVALGGEVYDALIAASLLNNLPIDNGYTRIARSALGILYYALRSLMAPAYLVLIATVSDTSHKLNSGNFVRFFLWVPMSAMLLLVLTNPVHHLLFVYDGGMLQRGPLVYALYAEAAYYSIVGIAWLFRWRSLLSDNEFAILIMLYPILLATAYIQYCVPELRLELFVTSVAMLLVSAFAIHPETRHDNLANAASLDAYREMCKRAFITGKPLCLVYVEFVNMEQLRQLVGKIELQGIIRRVSEKLAGTLERDDDLFYLRNGLFCISSRSVDPEHAEEVAWKFHEEGRSRSVSAEQKARTPMLRSCVVRVPEDVANQETLTNFGKRLAYLVPESTVTTFEKLSKRDDFKLQLALSGIIAKSIAERSFEVYYQPILCLEDGRFHSAEALVRLNDPEYGWVPPSLFIPEAEQSGAIIAIGSILLEKICSFLGTVDHDAIGLDYVEVNLSVDQCVRPELAGELLELLVEYKVDPKRVNLEITETSATYSQEAIEENMRTLAAEGLTLSIDDYGTGYSNVTRLLSLPFTLVKIDRSLVVGLDDESSRVVLAETVKMMKSIGKDVLVEGVETREQAEILHEMGVDYIQGYHYAMPMPEEEFIAFLREKND